MKTISTKTEVKKLIFNLIILAMLFILVMMIFPEGTKTLKDLNNGISPTQKTEKHFGDLS